MISLILITVQAIVMLDYGLYYYDIFSDRVTPREYVPNSKMIVKKRFLDEIPVPGKTDDSYDSVTRQYSYNLQPEVNELLREFRTGYFY